MPIHPATFLCLFTGTRTFLANWSTMVKFKKLAQPRLNPSADPRTLCQVSRLHPLLHGKRCSIQVMVSSLSSLWPVLGLRCPQQQHFEVCKLVIL